MTCLNRCENAEAYEVQDGGKSTGIFTKYLNKHILQPEKVTHILELVSEGQCSCMIGFAHNFKYKTLKL